MTQPQLQSSLGRQRPLLADVESEGSAPAYDDACWLLATWRRGLLASGLTVYWLHRKQISKFFWTQRSPGLVLDWSRVTSGLVLDWFCASPVLVLGCSWTEP